MTRPLDLTIKSRYDVNESSQNPVSLSWAPFEDLSENYNIPTTTLYQERQRDIMMTRALDLTIKGRYNLSESSQNIRKRGMDDDVIFRGRYKPRDYRKYSADDFAKAAQESIAGARVKDVSEKYNIPRSTLYKERQKNGIHHFNPNYSQQALNKAAQAKAPSVSYSELSKIYHVPRSTIHYRKNNLDKEAEAKKNSQRRVGQRKPEY